MSFAGRLTTRLVVERWAGVADGAGGVAAPSWRVVGKAWAELAGMGFRTEDGADAVVAKTRLTALLRVRDLDTGCRLRWGSRVFAVLATSQDPRTPDRMTALLEEVAG